MKKCCFTLVEILAVIAITGILTVGTAISMNRAWQNNRIDICESEMRDMTTALKSYYTDYGNILIEDDLNFEAVITETVDILNAKYLPYNVEITEISEDKRSVSLTTAIKTDPWNNKYVFTVYTYNGEDADCIPGLVVIASCGPDAKSNKELYTLNDFGDDVIAVVEPKI